jgi:hypothetical protein
MTIDNSGLLAALERVRVEWSRYTHACVEFLDEHAKDEPKYSGALLYEGLTASFALASVEAAIRSVPKDIAEAEAEAERRIRSEDETEVEPVQ